MNTNTKETIPTNTAERLSPEGRRPQGESLSAQSAQTHVSPKKTAPRRQFSNDYKLKILDEYEACLNPLDRGALLRREALYHSRITAWRQQRDAGRFDNAPRAKFNNRLQKITRENAALKKKLTQAQTIIDLQKKVSEMLGLHILQPDNND